MSRSPVAITGAPALDDGLARWRTRARQDRVVIRLVAVTNDESGAAAARVTYQTIELS
jgi:hypothetical protein